jgi:uncharacterized membrane protein YkoI
MSITQIGRKGLMTVGALGALALGGSAIANAAQSSSTATQGSNAAAPGYAATAQLPDPTTPGGHRGANGQVEKALSAGVAAKVKAAAEAKVSGGTVLRVETDVDHGSPYEAHVRKSDGTEVEVLVDSGFNVTAVNTMQHP